LLAIRLIVDKVEIKAKFAAKLMVDRVEKNPLVAEKDIVEREENATLLAENVLTVKVLARTLDVRRKSVVTDEKNP
jgi:hypothetical protein